MTKIVVTDNEQQVHAFAIFVIDPADMQEIITHAQTLHNKRAAKQSVQATNATEPNCEIARECHFGQDGKCLRDGVCV